MGNTGSTVCPNTEKLYKQCMRHYWNESYLASDNPNVCRDEFEDWKLCYQDSMSREVAEIRAQKLLDERKKQLEAEIATAPALGDRATSAVKKTNSGQDPQKEDKP